MIKQNVPLQCVDFVKPIRCIELESRSGNGEERPRTINVGSVLRRDESKGNGSVAFSAHAKTLLRGTGMPAPHPSHLMSYVCEFLHREDGCSA